MQFFRHILLPDRGGSPRLLLLLLISCHLATACSDSSSAPGSADAGTVSTEGAKPGERTVTGSGSDMYFEYTSKAVGSRISINSTIKMYIAANGKMRKEMTIRNSMTGNTPAAIVSIGDAAKPTESIQLDDSAKTWSRSSIDPNELLSDRIKIVSNTSKIGEETVQGFKSVHARVVSTKSIAGLSSQTDTVDLWKSEDVPVPAVFKSLEDLAAKMTGFEFAKEVPDQLQQMGCKGFLVRMDITGKELNSKMELTKVQKMDIPGNLLEIPAGYKEEKN